MAQRLTLTPADVQMYRTDGILCACACELAAFSEAECHRHILEHVRFMQALSIMYGGRELKIGKFVIWWFPTPAVTCVAAKS